MVGAAVVATRDAAELLGTAGGGVVSADGVMAAGTWAAWTAALCGRTPVTSTMPEPINSSRPAATPAGHHHPPARRR